MSYRPNVQAQQSQSCIQHGYSSELPNHLAKQLSQSHILNSNPAAMKQPLSTMQPSQMPNPKKKSARDYQFGAMIGEGSYSTVYSAMDKQLKKTYAIKVLSKRHIVKEGKIKYVNIEKTTLHRLGQQHPGIVQLYYTFQDESSLFFVLDFAEYGELLSIIRKLGSLSEPVSKFYMCQIIDAVRFIHLKGVIHRDLKPENILVGHDFNLKITDFGAAKLLGENEEDEEKVDYRSFNSEVETPAQTPRERFGSFVGTAEYVSPELLKDNICGFESDIWAIGCILYQFFNGSPPFKGSTEYLTFQKIIDLDYSYKSPKLIPKEVTEIIEKILVLNPSARPTIPDIMSFKWFSEVDWNDPRYIWHRKVPKLESYNSTESLSQPIMPRIKNGANREMNKSSSYHQLQSQINKSDLGFLPTFGAKKSFKPPTAIRKNTSQNSNGELAPQYLPNVLPLKRRDAQHAAPLAQVNQPVFKGSTNNIRSSIASPPQQPVPSQYATRPPQNQPLQPKAHVQGKPNIRANTAFQNMQPAPRTTTIPEASSQSPKSNSTSTPNAPSIAEGLTPYVPDIPKTSPDAAAAAAAFAKRNNIQTKPITTQKANLPPENPKSANKPNQKQTLLKLHEVSSLLAPSEKILKMDLLKRMRLRKSSLSLIYDTLDDIVLERIVTEHAHRLQEGSKLVLTFVTNMARIFLVDSTLEVMLVDLKANNGGDYFMYDYEFENDEEGLNDDHLGYLIIEVVKENGDLYFLQQLVNKNLEPEIIRVLDKAGHDASIGKEHGWIDCLLIARETSTASPVEPKTISDATTLEAKTNVVPASATMAVNGAPSRPTAKKTNDIKSKKGSGKKPKKKEIKRKVPSLPSLQSSPSTNQATNFARAAAAAVRQK